VLDLLIIKADQFSTLRTGTGVIHVCCKCRFHQDVFMCSLEYANDHCRTQNELCIVVVMYCNLKSTM